MLTAKVSAATLCSGGSGLPAGLHPQPRGPLQPRCSPPHRPSPPPADQPPRLSILTALGFQDENGHTMQRGEKQFGLCGHLASNKMFWDPGSPCFFLKHVMASESCPPQVLDTGWDLQADTCFHLRLSRRRLSGHTEGRGQGTQRGVSEAKAAEGQGTPGRPGSVEAETSSPQLCPLLCSAAR